MRYIFGGAFDPPTLAHMEIIEKLLSIMNPGNDELYIFVSDNDEKKYAAKAEDRVSMMEIALSHTSLDIPRDDIHIHIQKKRMLEELSMFQDVSWENTTLCIGFDQAEELGRERWENTRALMKAVRFVVFGRNTPNSSLGRFRDKIMYAVWDSAKYKMLNLSEDTEFQNISSTEVRKILEASPEAAQDLLSGCSLYCHSAILDFIYTHELYHQNGPKYEENFEAFLAQYKIDKEKHRWAEPSVTADIVAYTSSEEVLLIRRKNYPYKNYWALPGGFFDLTDKDINYTAARELKEETHVDLPPEVFEQLKTYAHVFDPRLRIVDVAFSARIPRDQEDKIGGDDDAAEAKLWPIWDLPKMAFHHKDIIAEHLKRKAAHDRQAN